jgi:hypothetical protein
MSGEVHIHIEELIVDAEQRRVGDGLEREMARALAGRGLSPALLAAGHVESLQWRGTSAAESLAEALTQWSGERTPGGAR